MTDDHHHQTAADQATCSDLHELESQRIRAGRCPECGRDVKDKGSYLRCTTCGFHITNGGWHQDEGWCYEKSNDGTVRTWGSTDTTFCADCCEPMAGRLMYCPQCREATADAIRAAEARRALAKQAGPPSNDH